MPFLVGYVTPQDFGAVGNGINDDTSAIQSALNGVSANGSTVFFPPGTYKITSSLNVIISGTQLVGSGWGSQITYDGNVVTPAIKATGNIFAVIRDLRVSNTNTSHLGTAIDASQLSDSVIQHVLVDGTGTGVTPLTGILLNANTSVDNVIRDCRIGYGGASSAGISIGIGANATTIQDTRLVPSGDDASSSGILISGATSTNINKVHVEGAAGYGVQISTNSHATTVNRLVTVSCNVGLRVVSGVIGTSIIGNSLTTSTTAGIQDSGIGSQIFNAWPNSGSNTYNHVSLANTDQFQVNGVPTPGNTFAPSDANLIAASYDVAAGAPNSTQVTSGTIYLAQVVLRYPTTVSKATINIATAASGVTANQNFLGFYDASGTRQAVTSAGAIDAGLGSTGPLTGTFSASYNAPAGLYWVAFLNNATTTAFISRSTSLISATNYNLSASAFRFAINGTSQTTLPATITPGSNTQTNAIGYWTAVL